MVPKHSNDKIDSIRERAKAKIERDFGPELLAMFNDPKTAEIMLNDDGQVWIDVLGEEEMRPVGYLRPAQARAIIETVAGFHGKEITREKPRIEGIFPLDGSRFSGQLPPIVNNATFTIRKRAVAIFTLDQYVEANIMTPIQKEAICQAVKEYKNILVVGGTGTGKTTLINAIIKEMVMIKPTERPIIIEDTGEVQCAAKNRIMFTVSEEVDMSELLRTTLRMRPDRILVGEVRGPEAQALLMAWNTGHEGGAATIHSNNARAGLSRLKMLISMNEFAPSPIEPLIGEAVHIIVSIAKTPEGRKVKEILRVKGFEDNNYILEYI